MNTEHEQHTRTNRLNRRDVWTRATPEELEELRRRLEMSETEQSEDGR